MTLLAAHVGAMTTDAQTGPLAYLWEDAETTGLENGDHLLEISVIATDKDLNELESYSTIVRPQADTFERIAGNEIVARMHLGNGLLDELRAHGADAPGEREVEQALCAMVERHRGPGGTLIRLAGGGVSHFDFPYLKHRMPGFAGLLHYRPLDITQVSQAYTDATGSSVFGEKRNKAHRAEADIREDLDRARAFWQMFRELDARLSGDWTPPKLNGRESVLAGVEIIRAYEAAFDQDDSSQDALRDLIERTRESDALAGVTAVAAHLAGMVANSTELTVDDVLQIARRALISKRPQSADAPRM